jgi:hypothetical protein
VPISPRGIRCTELLDWRRGPRGFASAAARGERATADFLDGPLVRLIAFIAVLVIEGCVATSGVTRTGLPRDFNWHDEAIAPLVASNPAALDVASIEERARIVKILMHGPKVTLRDEEKSGAMNVLARTPSLDRFRVFRLLDQTQETELSVIYEKLDPVRRALLLELCADAGAAADEAKLEEIGIVSDIDDTAIPFRFHPNGLIAFEGATEFYDLLETGTDGKGERGDLHFVSAEPKILKVTRGRLEAAKLPYGTIDNRRFDQIHFVNHRAELDAIERSKVANITTWIALHPRQKFVFLGDTIQRDPEVYRAIAKAHPECVAAVFIHEAGGVTKRAPADYPNQILFDTYAHARAKLLDLKIVGSGAHPY